MLNAIEIKQEYDSVRTKYAHQIGTDMEIRTFVSPTGATRIGVLGNNTYALYIAPSALGSREDARKEMSKGLEMLTALALTA